MYPPSRTHLPIPGAFLLFLLASICANGCSEDSSDNETLPQNVNVCTSNADCAARLDGLTQCDIANYVCVSPQAQVTGCTSDADCSARMDGKTRCDMILHQCVVPTPVAQGCTSDANCIARTDGKTRCDMASRQCVFPQNTQGFCGNAYIDAGEDCDGTLFVDNKTTCSAWNAQYTSGNVSCNNCKVDLSNCSPAGIPVCNNGIIDAGEDCDGPLFVDNKNTCSAWNAQYTSGSVSFNNCKVDLSKCSTTSAPTCNNGKIDPGEDCDGSLFANNKNTCAAWNAQYISGSVSCNNCELDFSKCVTDSPECTNGDAECIEKELSIKKCIKGKWVTEECPNLPYDAKPYCKTGAEACSRLLSGEPCTPNNFVPHYGGDNYIPPGYDIFLCPHTGSVVKLYQGSGYRYLKAKRGYGVGPEKGAEKCNAKGMVRTIWVEDSKASGYACQKCKVELKGDLYWLYVPATYTNEGFTVSCVPWDDVE